MSQGKPELYRIRRLVGANGSFSIELRYLASAEGWVMYRVHRGGVSVMPRGEWDKLERGRLAGDHGQAGGAQG
jgi:hypothetical protein